MGVDVNTASTPLLSRVSGIGDGLAPGLSAGFLRIRDGDDPLDRSGVHPEAYSIVRRVLAASKSKLETLIDNTPSDASMPQAGSWRGYNGTGC